MLAILPEPGSLGMHTINKRVRRKESNRLSVCIVAKLLSGVEHGEHEKQAHCTH